MDESPRPSRAVRTPQRRVDRVCPPTGCLPPCPSGNLTILNASESPALSSAYMGPLECVVKEERVDFGLQSTAPDL
jgi:hypothetical protein